VASFFSPQLKRLFGYVRPYRFRMTLGVVLLAIVALAEGAVTLLIVPIFDRVLNPATSDSNVLLFKVPFGGPPVYVNHLFPHSIHNVWTVVTLSMLVLFGIKSLCEFAGVSLIQYVGHRAITDLRNAVYAKIIRQPIGFFQQQSAGRVFSAVINDVERARLAISEYLAELFRQIFLFPVFLFILLYIDWKMALACGVFLPLIVWPISKWAAASAVPWRIARPAWRTYADSSGDRRRQSHRKSFRNGRFRNREFSVGFETSAARNDALGPRAGGHLAAHGLASAGRHFLLLLYARDRIRLN